MIERILRNGGKRINAFRVYLYLNARSEGHIYITNDDRKQIAADLSLHYKTVGRLLDELQKWNWVGFDKNTGGYHIRGFGGVAKREGEKSRQGFFLDLDEYLPDARRFKAFIAAAWINNLGRYKVHLYFARKDKYRGRDEERLKGRFAPKSRPRMLYWWYITATYISKILGVAVSTAHEYRKLAEEYGFIEVKRRREEIPPELLTLWETSDDEEEVKKSKRIRKQNGRLLLDSPLWIRSQVIHYRRLPRYKRKKNRILPPSSLKSSISPLDSLDIDDLLPSLSEM